MAVEQLLMGILASLIANGLTTFGLTTLARVGTGQTRKVTARTDAIRDALVGNTRLMSAIRDAALSNAPQATMIQLFLESPTAETIVRQMYSELLHDGTRQKSTGDLQKEFRLCLAYHLGMTANDVEQLATALFEVIDEGCRQAFHLAIEQGILSAHEATSIARHRALLDEFQAIRSNLDFLTAHTRLDLNAIRDFETLYREQVRERSRQVTIPHFDRAPRVDIDRIFVSPHFVPVPKNKEGRPETMPLDDFLVRLHRSVLLGDPGGGKSTLAQKICYELGKNYDGRLVGNRLLTPILVVLREYSSKKTQGLSIVQFIEGEVTSKYQLPQGPPLGALEYLLHNGHALVIFDGLDELLDPSHRRVISADVESFCNMFPSVPVLVTSRVVGYEQAPLDPERFETFRIAPFDDEQVSEYAHKWFGNDTDLAPTERELRAAAFLQESTIVSDLRSNPLMLALMCNLHRGAGFIPRNRPEVYRKCSEMLFERWDPSRGIWVHLPISEPKVLLGHLAHWVYSDGSLQSGVTESQLVRESTQFLCPRRFEVEEEAERASREFIEYCRGRAWVFAEAGTTPEGTRLYKFTHRTFLEYFTAAHIVRNNNSPRQLWTVLGRRIAMRAWDVVAQLAFQMLHEQVEGACDELLTLILDRAQNDDESGWPCLSFGARCLRFVYPSPKTTRALTEAVTRCVVEGIPHPPYVPHGELGAFGPNVELMSALLRAALECRSTVTVSLEGEVLRYADSADDQMAIRAIELGMTLASSVLAWYEGPLEASVRDHWAQVEARLSGQVQKRMESLARHDFPAFGLLFDRSIVSVEQLFEWYTPDHLFV
ncbi:MAG: NACHT domain-containing protein, partial [Chloroflexota bacterium]